MKEIIEKKDYILNHTVSCNKLFNPCDDTEKMGILIADKGIIYFVEENSNVKQCIGGFSISDGYNKIECNRLAKSFVNNFTLKQLQSEYKEIVMQKIEAEKLFHEKAIRDLATLKELSEKLNFQFNDDNFAIHTIGTVLKYYCNKKIDYSTEKRWNYRGYSIDFEISVVTEKTFKVDLKANINSYNYTHIENNIFSENELIEYINKWFNVYQEQEDIIKIHTKEDIKSDMEKFNRMKFVDDILNKGNLLILKGKRSATAYYKHGNKYGKFSCKGEGRFYAVKYDNIIDAVCNAKEYFSISDDEYHQLKSKDIITFINIPNF